MSTLRVSLLTPSRLIQWAQDLPATAITINLREGRQLNHMPKGRLKKWTLDIWHSSSLFSDSFPGSEFGF